MVNGTALYIGVGILITLFVGGPMLWYQNKGQEKRLRVFEREEERMLDQGQELTSLQQDRRELRTCRTDLDRLRTQRVSLEGERNRLLNRLRERDEELQRTRAYQPQLFEAENRISTMRLDHAAALENITAAMRRQRNEDEARLRSLQERYDFVEQQYRELATEQDT